MTRTTIIIALVATLAAIFPSSALADRQATMPEARAMIAALDTAKLHWLNDSQIDSIVPGCAVERVSTTNPGWGSVDAQWCTDVMSYYSVRKVDGVWTHSETYGGEFVACPWSSVMPLRAQHDLKMCKPPVSRLRCHPPTRSSFVDMIRPARCNSFDEGDSFATSVNLVQLKWTAWGGPIARGTGISRGFRSPNTNIPVAVVAFARERNQWGDYQYTKLRAASRHGAVVVVMD